MGRMGSLKVWSKSSEAPDKKNDLRMLGVTGFNLLV